jgi:hypothetical protein
VAEANRTLVIISCSIHIIQPTVISTSKILVKTIMKEEVVATITTTDLTIILMLHRITTIIITINLIITLDLVGRYYIETMIIDELLL